MIEAATKTNRKDIAEGKILSFTVLHHRRVWKKPGWQFRVRA
jgi:hypothetical protein